MILPTKGLGHPRLSAFRDTAGRLVTTIMARLTPCEVDQGVQGLMCDRTIDLSETGPLWPSFLSVTSVVDT